MDKNEMKHIELIDKVLPIQPDFELKTVRLFNIDCMLFMKEIPDNYYELAIVDPPYGIGQASGIEMGKWKRHIHKEKNWDDCPPDKSYFDELFRISKNQVIWGGNYFLDYLGNTRCFLVWDKKNGTNPMSDCELAWTSFDSSVRKFTYNHIQDFNKNIKRIHPTQKPIELYKWILMKYAEHNQKIIDTHGGSCSIGCACMDMDFDIDICEIDKEYFDNAVNRLKNNVQEYLEFT